MSTKRRTHRKYQAGRPPAIGIDEIHLLEHQKLVGILQGLSRREIGGISQAGEEGPCMEAWPYLLLMHAIQETGVAPALIEHFKACVPTSMWDGEVINFMVQTLEALPGDE